MSPVIDIVVPVLHRPQNVHPFMTSLRETVGYLARVTFVIESGDEIEAEEILRHDADVLEFSGTFPVKVNHAWRALEAKGVADWFMPVGDDVVFREQWLFKALDAAQDKGWDMVSTNDLLNPEAVYWVHAIHPIIRSSYIREQGASWDGPGTVCHEGYNHTYVDNEWSTVALSRQTLGFVQDSVVEHMHPFNGKGAPDEIYEKGYKDMAKDGQLFVERRDQYLK